MYTTAKTLLFIQRVELIDEKKFAKTALNENFKTFVLYVAALKAPQMAIHPFQAAQVASLKANKTITKLLSEYSDYANVFLTKLAIELPEHNNINDHAIKLKKSKQHFFGPIYSLGQVKLETLKTYIETYVKTGFI